MRIRHWLGEKRAVHVYFDNDAERAAPRNALTLLEMLVEHSRHRIAECHRFIQLARAMRKRREDAFALPKLVRKEFCTKCFWNGAHLRTLLISVSRLELV